MSDVAIIIAVGTLLFLLLAAFIAFMTLAYQKRRLQHEKEITGIVEAYQKEMLKAQLEMQEQTFLSISQEIHDNIGQILSLARLNMSTLGDSLTKEAQGKVTNSKQLIDQAIQDLRSLSKRLNSKYVANQPLSALLKFQLELISKTGAADTSFKIIGEEYPIPAEKRLIAFRIVQEALNNILKHAEATTIKASITFLPGRMTLSISDNGIGFAEAAQLATGEKLSAGTGLSNMQYRATLIGGSLRIDSMPGAGTRVSLELPC